MIMQILPCSICTGAACFVVSRKEMDPIPQFGGSLVVDECFAGEQVVQVIIAVSEDEEAIAPELGDSGT